MYDDGKAVLLGLFSPVTYHLMMLVERKGRGRQSLPSISKANMTGKDEPPINADAELSVLRLSKNDTWENLNVRRKSSFDGNVDPAPLAVEEEDQVATACEDSFLGI